MLLAAADPASEEKVFNLGSDEHLNLEALAAMLVRLHGNGKYEVVPFPPEREVIDIGDYYGGFDRIKNALGWSPKVCLDEGLTCTLRYYRQHHAHYWNSSS
jgi:nucleoside-diphosphate-sugar epimerase